MSAETCPECGGRLDWRVEQRSLYENQWVPWCPVCGFNRPGDDETGRDTDSVESGRDFALPDIIIDPHMPTGRFVTLTEEVLDQLQREGWSS